MKCLTYNSRLFSYLTLSQNYLSILLKSVKFSSIMSSNPLESAKKLAAIRAVDENVSSKTSRIGIGSGSTIIYGVQRLAQRVKEEKLDLICVPTSYQAKQLIRKYGLKLSDLEESPELDLTIDGADEVDERLDLIKGGGGCLTQEKIVASASKMLIIVADYTKRSTNFGQNWTKGVPIEVIPMSYLLVKTKIEKLYKGSADLRMGVSKAGPLVTDNGNFIIDWKFPNTQELCDWDQINTNIKMIAGVVETGLFIKMAQKVYFCDEKGSVSLKLNTFVQ